MRARQKPSSLCSEYLYKIKDWINSHFIVHISKNYEHTLTDDEVNKSLCPGVTL